MQTEKQLLRSFSADAIRVDSHMGLYGYSEKTCFDQVTISSVGGKLRIQKAVLPREIAGKLPFQTNIQGSGYILYWHRDINVFVEKRIEIEAKIKNK